MNLLSAAPAANFSAPASPEGVGFSDILQQAQGLNLGELREAVEFAIDVQEPLSMAPPAGLADAQVTETLQSLLQAAEIGLSDGTDLPDVRELSALLEGLDLQALREQISTLAAGETVQNVAVLEAPLEATVVRLDLQQTAMAPELLQRVAELSEQLSRWSASLAQVPMASQSSDQATQTSLTQLQQTLSQLVERLPQDAVAPATVTSSPVGGSTDPLGPVAAANAVAGDQPMNSAASMLVAPSVSFPGVSEPAAVSRLSTVQQPAVSQRPHSLSASAQQASLVSGSAIASGPVDEMPSPTESAAQRGTPIEVASVRPLLDGEAGDRRPALTLRDRLAADNQLSLREVVSGGAGLRDTAPLTNLDQMVRGSSSALEARTVSVDPTVTLPAGVTRTETTNPALASRVPLLADETTQVWVRSGEEVPERILQQVSRMHANALRLQAGGATDFVQRLTLHLNPAELGQVEVQLRAADQVSVTFSAREASTRDLLDAGVARLRQMFEEQGLSLGDVEVGGQSSQREAEERWDGRPGGAVTGEEIAAAPMDTRQPRVDDGTLHVIA